MAYASRSGRAVTNPRNPRAFGVCDRCGIWYNLEAKLNYQYEWQGTRLQNLNLRVCPKCMDIPQPQLKARILPPDPVPVRNPRPENFYAERLNNLVTDGPTYQAAQGPPGIGQDILGDDGPITIDP